MVVKLFLVFTILAVIILFLSRPQTRSNFKILPHPIPKIQINLLPKKSSILLISPSSHENIIDYANVNGLDYINCPENEKEKWKFIYNILVNSTYEYLFYIGPHVRVVNQQKPVTKIIECSGDRDMILCRDEHNHSKVSIDVFILRRTYWASIKATYIYNMYDQGKFDSDIIIDQLYIPDKPSLIKAKELIDKGVPYLSFNTCVYNEHAFNSTRSSFLANGAPREQIDIYPWISIPDYVEIEKNLEKLPANPTSGNDQYIPKYIFQTLETNLVSKDFYLQCMKKWIDMNPEYQYFFFDSIDRRNFIREKFGQFIHDMYDKFIPGAYKADLWRYCVLYTYGGCYADSQTVPIVALSNIIEKKLEFVIPYDSCDGIDGLMSGFMCSIPNHKILNMSIVDSCLLAFFGLIGKNTLDITGPHRLGKSAVKILNKKDLIFTEGITGKERIKILGRKNQYVTWEGDPVLRIKYEGYNLEKFSRITGVRPYSMLWKEGIVYKPMRILPKYDINRYEILNCDKFFVNTHSEPRRLTNPGICKHGNKYKIIFRTWGKNYSSLEISDFENGRISYPRPIENNSPEGCMIYSGFEDPRVFVMNGDVHALVTARTDTCHFQPFLLNIDKNITQKINPLFDYENKNVKNWSPFIEENNEQLYTVSINPHIIAKIENGDAIVKYITSNDILSGTSLQPYFFRGSVGCVKTSIGLLGTAHIVLNPNDYSKRRYQNFFYKVQETPPYSITDVSSYFKLDSVYQIEFLCGMALGLDNNSLIMTFGIEDKNAQICIVNLDEVERLFQTQYISQNK